MLNCIRWTSIIANIFILGWFSYNLNRRGFPNADEALGVMALLIGPVSTLLYFYLNRPKRQPGSKSSLGELMGLELEARKATLRRRIKETDASQE